MNTVDSPPFAALLRHWRRTARLSQEELAERAGISMDTISALERGISRSPYRATVTSLADALELGEEDRALFLAAARERRSSRPADRRPGPARHAPAATSLCLVPAVDELEREETAISSTSAAAVGDEQRLPIGGFLGARPRGPLMGRAVELESALRLLEAEEGESGRVLLLAGEAGVGKTRLAQEISLRLRDRSFLICAGTCHETRQTSAYAPFLEVFAALYALAPPSLQAEVPPRWPYLAALLPAAAFPLPPAEGGGSMDRLLWSVSSFLQAISGYKPVALLLDDLHWADRSSLEMLQHIARQTRSDRVAIVGTYRDGGRQPALERTLHELERGGLVERIALQRLSREATAATAAAHLGEGEIGEEFAELLYERTEGNPFFLRQVVRDLIEKGELYRDGGSWVRKDTARIAVPESIRSAVVQRVAKLSATTREILHAASVFGQTFWFDDLLALTERDERELDGALEEAMQAAMVQELDGERYAFDHALTRQALYAQLTARRQRKLHGAAGEALERLPERKRNSRLPELAWHFSQGDDGEKALAYSLQAGDAAEAIYAHAEGEMHYRAAVDLARELEDEAREAEALERLAELFFRTFQFAKQLEVAHRAAELYRRLGDLEGEGRVVGRSGAAYTHLGRKKEGIEWLEPLRQRFEGRPPSPAHVALYEGLVTLYWQSGRLAEAEAVSQRLLEAARSLGDDGILARAQGRRGVVLSFLPGREAEGQEAILESIRLAERVGDLLILLVGAQNMASQYEMWGDWKRACLYNDRHLDVARRMGSPVRTVSALLERAELNLWHGEIAASRASLQEALRVARSARTQSLGRAPTIPGQLLMLEGEAERARTYLESRIHQGNLTDAPVVLGDPREVLAKLHGLEGRLEAAREWYERLLVQRDAHPKQRAQLLLDLAAILLEMRREEATRAAGTLLEEALASEVVRSYLWNRLRAQALAAWLRAADGNLDEGVRLMEETLMAARSSLPVVLQTDLLMCSALMLSQLGEMEGARRTLQQAADTYRRIELVMEQRRAERLLAQLSTAVT